MFDLLIKNASVLDGSGKPAVNVDVAVSGDKVVLIREGIDAEAERIIDAKGLYLSPGFIDPHTHSDIPLIIDPRAESKIRQGVTTEVMGNCGMSAAPLVGPALDEAVLQAEQMGYELTWADMASYINRLESQGIAVNVVVLTGHNTLRGCVLGYDDVQPDEDQQRQMEDLLQKTLDQGAAGLSSGLYYPPGYYAKSEEMVALAKVVAKNQGCYTTHIRSESDGLFESIEEAIEVGRQSGVKTQISHLKLEGHHNFAGVDRLLQILDSAKAEGIKLGVDQYPYTASSTWLPAILPNWLQAGGNKAVSQRLRDPKIRAELKKDYRENRVDWENRGGMKTWDDILITEAYGRPDANGKTVAEIAKSEGKDPLDTAFDLIIDCEGGPSAVFFDQLEENVRTILAHPGIMVSSDGASLAPDGPLGYGTPHPRNYGTFPRVLGKYVREEKVLSLETAIKKMTSLPADFFGLEGRGRVNEGSFADLVLFDAETIIDQATFTDPHQFPLGIPYVIVNGEIVIDNYQHSGKLNGKVLK